jgi:quinoprotein glucose dehydrogenase
MSAFSRRALLSASAATAATLGLSRAGIAQPVVPVSLTKVPTGDTEWRHFGGDLAHTRYAPLDQINAQNFGNLEVAWRTGTSKFGEWVETRLESTPLLIKGRLFATGGTRRNVISMNAETGEILWVYRLDEGERAMRGARQKSGRGVAYWTDGKEERIYFVTMGYRLVALDANTGQPVQGFGDKGIIDLKLDNDQTLDPLRAEIGLHATPTVANDVVIVGAAHMSGDVPARHQNARGYVRGFDARTGKRLWIFHTIPLKGEYGYDSWIGGSEGAGNGGVWAQIAADEDLGLAYLGVELPTGDEVGHYRKGNALFGESIVAVDTRTGKRKWHYQLVHHGLWDMDIPCAAVLCDIPVNGKIVKAIAQPTKQSWLYVLDRETGKPIWPIVERPVPKGNVPGEWYSPTQPFPTKPPAYDRQGVAISDLIDFTPALRKEATELVKHFKIGPIFTPPTLSVPGGPFGTLCMPGLQGGTNWPGASYDPDTHKVYVYSKTQLALIGIIKNNNTNVSDLEYVHGVAGVNPGLARPQGALPGAISPRPVGVADNAPDIGAAPIPADQRAPRLSVQGLPVIKPPYGRLTAIDLTKGDISWQITHGATPDEIKNHSALKGLDIPRTGHAANIGPLTTKTLVILGDGISTTDEKGRGAYLRAYDKASGKELAALRMPAPQTGSPITYMLKGRQYIVLAISDPNYPAEFVALRLPGGAPARRAGGNNDG